MAKKIFVIDTNVLLHDYTSIYNFEENDVVIPIIVLEELDYFKKGNDLINFHAREFTRELDMLSQDYSLSKGIPLGEGKGKLFVETGKPFSEKVQMSFSDPKPDHRILAVADFLKTKNPKKKVVLISKDINLRMKAKSLDIESEDYKTGKVIDIDFLERFIKIEENFNEDIIKRFYAEPTGIPKVDIELSYDPKPNDCFIFKGENSSVLARYNAIEGWYERVEKKSSYGIEPRNAEQAFALSVLNDNDIQLIAITGKAGTGKTLLALAAALNQRRMYRQILLARPIVPLSNRDLGFLPGDVKDKIGPYMMPLFDNLSVIKHQFKADSPEFNKIDEMLKQEKLLISPLAYIRGRSLSNVFFIIDESQNLTPHEIKTIVTRAGEGTKIIFTGDINQIDTPYLDSKSNGLSYLTDKMKGQQIFAHINLVKGERSHLAELASDLL